MRSCLKHIEVENFKSFCGRITIGPLKSFNAVIGPNGSGKSNFMDAISFVMGEKTTSLRVKRLSDLIHGAHIGKPVSKVASVTAVFSLDDGTEKNFQRSVNGSSSEYRINSTVVTNAVYLQELEKLRINVKAKNFLIFQGQVESVAMMDPKEITLLFEEISGSGTLKVEYDRLKQQMQKAQEDFNYVYQKKKIINAERKSALLENEEADKYAKLNEHLSNKLIEHQLFKLFHNERAIERLEKEIVSKQKDFDKLERKKETAEEVLKEKKKDQVRLARELAKTEQEIREMDAKISKNHPDFIKTTERVVHMQKKLDNARKTLERARKANNAHNNDIAQLQAELNEVAERRAAYEATIASQSESQGSDVHLEDEQVNEYHHLKEEAVKRSAHFLQQLDSINREQKADQDRLDNVTRLRTEVENRHRQKQREKDEMEKRIEKLEEHIRTSEQKLNEQRKLQLDLSADVNSSKARVTEIQKQLEVIVEQLGDARVDKHEDARRKKKQEVVERFKSNYSGVYDRMITMCQPTHPRYNVAITKVFGKFMEAIVVDTEHTAKQCIQYLKEQMLEPETFLPLDYIKVKPVKERLRNIKDPKGVKLLYDVLQFEPEAISNAVMFATNNALVCETPEDAMKVAYEMDDHERYDVVALDGTYYQKSGLISGGSLDLARKAKRWDEKHISQLKLQKENLTEELRETIKTSRKESKLNTVILQVKGLETRLKYSTTDKEKTNKQINVVEEELANLSEEMNNFGPNQSEIERTMQEREQHIEEIKVHINREEDIVFAKFCERIGVRNIRHYEKRTLRMHEQRKQKRLEFDRQFNRITSNLEFEKSRGTQSNVSRWEQTVHDNEEQLKTFKKEEAKHQLKIDKDMRQVESLKQEKLSRKLAADQMDIEVGQTRREVETIAKDIQAAQKQTAFLEREIENKQCDRHNILKQCRMEGIVLPMLVGNMADIVEGTGHSSDSDQPNTAQQHEREVRIKIAYDILSDAHKNLEERDEVQKCSDKLLQSIKSLQDTITKVRAPNTKSLLNLEQTQGKLLSINEEFEKMLKQNKTAKTAFERVQVDRFQRFTQCFEHVSNEIDNIYKCLTKNQSAQAVLTAGNPEEPYLDRINYNCVAPGKNFQPMSYLSGGEKTIAALALLFAIHSFQPAPFFVLDEIDAALDNTNINKVVSFIREKSSMLQTIVISLKEEFFNHADLLIGVYSQSAECSVSEVITIDLTKYLPADQTSL